MRKHEKLESDGPIPLGGHITLEVRGNPEFLKAKKEFEIQKKDYQRIIKKGDYLGDVPEKYLEGLLAEGVL